MLLQFNAHCDIREHGNSTDAHLGEYISQSHLHAQVVIVQKPCLEVTSTNFLTIICLYYIATSGSLRSRYDSVENSDFIEFTNFEVGLYFRDRCAHCIRDESPLFGTEAPGTPHVSVHDHFGTECRSKRQFGSLNRYY